MIFVERSSFDEKKVHKFVHVEMFARVYSYMVNRVPAARLTLKILVLHAYIQMFHIALIKIASSAVADYK